jgi:two-component system cell cycle sensor histidine kinase/response regulator CckA
MSPLPHRRVADLPAPVASAPMGSAAPLVADPGPLLSAVLGLIPEAYLLVDADGAVREWSSRACDLFGWRADEVSGKRVHRFLVAPRDRRRVREQLEAAGRAGSAEACRMHLEFTAVCREGQTAPVAARVGCVGELRLLLLRLVDESERTAAETLRSLFRAVPEGVMIVDPAGRVRELNPAALEIFGAPEGTDATLDSLVSPEDRESVRRCVHAAAAGERQECRYTGLRAGGELFPLSLAITPSVYGGRRMLVAIAHDLSGWARAQEELADANQRLRALFAASPLATVVLDRDQKVTLWNPAAERIFGWRRDEVLHRTLPWVNRPEIAASSSALLERVFNGEVLRDVEIRRVRRDGQPMDISLSAAPVYDGAGAIVGAVSLMADISGRLEMQAELRQAQKLEAVGSLAGGVAHDFNNILTVVQGNTELLLSDYRDQGYPAPEDLLEIQRAVHRARALTGQLLVFSRKRVREPQIVDVNRVLGELDKMLRRLIGADVELVTVLGRDVWRVRADPGELEQAVANLVVNARDAMPAGGRLSIETANFPGRRMAPDRPEEDWVAIRVRDTGHGMEARVLERIFEPFFTTKPSGKGTGLGLWTVYGMARQAGGYVRVRTEVGNGSEFTILLPAVQEQADEVEEPRPQAPVTQIGGRVLLVEDEPMLRRVAARSLQRYGVEVVTAENGEEGLRTWQARRDELDLLLTDVVMPLMGGRELAARIRESGGGLPILFMSGYTEDDPRTLPGADVRFIRKPFGPDELARVVAGMLAERGRAAEG